MRFIRRCVSVCGTNTFASSVLGDSASNRSGDFGNKARTFVGNGTCDISSVHGGTPGIFRGLTVASFVTGAGPGVFVRVLAIGTADGRRRRTVGFTQFIAGSSGRLTFSGGTGIFPSSGNAVSSGFFGPSSSAVSTRTVHVSTSRVHGNRV